MERRLGGGRPAGIVREASAIAAKRRVFFSDLLSLSHRLTSARVPGRGRTGGRAGRLRIAADSLLRAPRAVRVAPPSFHAKTVRDYLRIYNQIRR